MLQKYQSNLLEQRIIKHLQPIGSLYELSYYKFYTISCSCCVSVRVVRVCVIPLLYSACSMKYCEEPSLYLRSSKVEHSHTQLLILFIIMVYIISFVMSYHTTNFVEHHAVAVYQLGLYGSVLYHCCIPLAA